MEINERRGELLKLRNKHYQTSAAVYERYRIILFCYSVEYMILSSFYKVRASRRQFLDKITNVVRLDCQSTGFQFQLNVYIV